ncbi:MAG: DUF2301 domain-containing membrane protein [Myxococcota bacterium]
MADPDHVPVLDRFDRMTVTLYRTGLVGQAVGLSVIVASELGSVPRALGVHVMLAAVALSVGNLHLYDKRIRWIIGTSGWVGAVMVASTSTASGFLEPLLHYGGQGFLFVVTSALALKERYCFKLPGVQLVPVGLAASVATGIAGLGELTAGLVGICGIAVGLLALAKLRMPVHYDIGNKSAYQI